MAENSIKEKKKNPSIVHWKGLLADRMRAVRLITAAMLAVLCLSLSFCQLGFLDISTTDESAVYAVAMLLPVALGAVLLGILWGFLIGLFAGGVMYFHATYMPLDYYELTFVTSNTAVAIMAVIGLVLGFFMAVMLRKRPGPVKSALYIVIACVIASSLFSFMFFINVIVQITADAISSGLVDASTEEISPEFRSEIATMAFRLGHLGEQFLANAGIMSVACIIADAVVRRMHKVKGSIGLRRLFATWLFAVVLFVFLVTAGASFVSITQEEYRDAEQDMKEEVGYLCNQLGESVKHGESLERFLDRAGISVDSISPEEFEDLVSALSIDSLLTGYTLDGDGTVFISYAEDYLSDVGIMQSNDDRFPVETVLSSAFDDDFLDAIASSRDTGEVNRAVYDPVHLTNESLPTSDSMAKSSIVYVYAQQQDFYQVTMIKTSDMVFSDRNSVMIWTTLSQFALLLAVFLLVQLLLSRVVVRRIDETNGVLARITGGDLNARVAVSDTRELESLSEGINNTVDALEGWIAEAETRMDAELATAKAIQEAALPSTFPPYPDIMKLDIYATMKAAKEVGGDFYDFFLIGDDVGLDAGMLAFIIADVSGKGVPAALFMMRAKSQIRSYLESGMEIGEAVENANRQLCDGNKSGMFVTAWVGVLDYGTMHVDYVNAGHNPPLLWQRETGWQWLAEKSGMPLGLFDGFGYEAFSVDCAIGDQFLLYTDGVTEAMNVDDQLYGEGRLKALAEENFTLHPRKLVDAVRSSVAEYARGAEQSDDITILALEVGVPPEVSSTIVVPANVEELPRVNDFIHTELDMRLCPVRAQHQLDIAVEELFVNVCHYAYPEATPDNPGMVRISYTYSKESQSISVDISDDGVPYNPLAKPDAVTPDDIMEVPIGGLGILMAKRSVDDMTYERADNSNVVTILKKW